MEALRRRSLASSFRGSCVQQVLLDLKTHFDDFSLLPAAPTSVQTCGVAESNRNASHGFVGPAIVFHPRGIQGLANMTNLRRSCLTSDVRQMPVSIVCRAPRPANLDVDEPPPRPAERRSVSPFYFKQTLCGDKSAQRRPQSADESRLANCNDGAGLNPVVHKFRSAGAGRVIASSSASADICGFRGDVPPIRDFHLAKSESNKELGRTREPSVKPPSALLWADAVSSAACLFDTTVFGLKPSQDASSTQPASLASILQHFATPATSSRNIEVDEFINFAFCAGDDEASTGMPNRTEAKCSKLVKYPEERNLKTTRPRRRHDPDVMNTPRFEVAASPVRQRHLSPMGRLRSTSPPRHKKTSERALRMTLHVSTFLAADKHPEAACLLAERMIYDSLPPDNVQGLRTKALHNPVSLVNFRTLVQQEGGNQTRIRCTWHLAGSEAAALSIEATGICCDDGHCSCGRYGGGGYVTESITKANAYKDSDGNGGDRTVFLVLTFPEEELIRGVKGTRPPSTAVDLPSHPTEYCFVDAARLHCVCRCDYRWLPTGRRSKVVAAGGQIRAWRNTIPSPSSPAPSAD